MRDGGRGGNRREKEGSRMCLCPIVLRCVRERVNE